MNEVWKEVKGFEGLYWVSNTGRIKTKKRQGSQGGILKNTPTNTGYEMMRFQNRKENKFEAELIHRVVANAFIPNPENKPQVNHINSIRTDNRVENLEWCTNLENVRHSQSVGRFNHSGEENNSSKLTEKEVVEIRLLAAKKIKDQLIANAYGVCREQIGTIRRRQQWNHVKMPTYIK